MGKQIQLITVILCLSFGALTFILFDHDETHTHHHQRQLLSFPSDPKHVELKQTTFLIPKSPDPVPSHSIHRVTHGAPNHSLSNCVPTSQFEIDLSMRQHGVWTIRTLSPDGTLKRNGGDELYVTYKDDNNNSISPSAVARITDRGDGSYELKFYRSRSPALFGINSLRGTGTVTIQLRFTCFTGYLDPPLKIEWDDNGMVNTEYSQTNMPYPPLHDMPLPKQFPELSSYDYVLAIGDSTFYRFVIYQNKPNLIYGQYRYNTNMKTVYSYYLPSIQKSVNDNGLQTNTNSAMILGSCVWDVYGPHFQMDAHLEAIKVLISDVRKKYPQWGLYWKSCTALHNNVLPMEMSGVRTMKYQSHTRTYLLDKMQKRLMHKLNVPILDVFELSYEMSEFRETPTDARHYNEDFHRIVDNYMFGGAWSITG